jgi:hypothetical protein
VLQSSEKSFGLRIVIADMRPAELITQACLDGDVDPRGLVLLSDNGKPMRANIVIATLHWLGVVPSLIVSGSTSAGGLAAVALVLKRLGRRKDASERRRGPA